VANKAGTKMTGFFGIVKKAVVASVPAITGGPAEERDEFVQQKTAYIDALHQVIIVFFVQLFFFAIIVFCAIVFLHLFFCNYQFFCNVFPISNFFCFNQGLVAAWKSFHGLVESERTLKANLAMATEAASVMARAESFDEAGAEQVGNLYVS
jgi:hypothetical protein